MKIDRIDQVGVVRVCRILGQQLKNFENDFAKSKFQSMTVVPR